MLPFRWLFERYKNIKFDISLPILAGIVVDNKLFLRSRVLTPDQSGIEPIN